MFIYKDGSMLSVKIDEQKTCYLNAFIRGEVCK